MYLTKKYILLVLFVKQGFTISKNGVVAEIQHSHNGLPNGTFLQSVVSNKIWEVTGRLTFSHVEHLQVLFENETLSPVLMSFASTEQLEQSKAEILESEKNNIFQYLIYNRENSLPKDGEELIAINL